MGYLGHFRVKQNVISSSHQWQQSVGPPERLKPVFGPKPLMRPMAIDNLWLMLVEFQFKALIITLHDKHMQLDNPNLDKNAWNPWCATWQVLPPCMSSRVFQSPLSENKLNTTHPKLPGIGNMSGVRGSLLRPFLMAHFFPFSRFILWPQEARAGTQRFLTETLERWKKQWLFWMARLMKKIEKNGCSRERMSFFT